MSIPRLVNIYAHIILIIYCVGLLSQVKNYKKQNKENKR